ncbi:four helix bundle protein [Calditrichota bacterium LG25]
MKADDLEKRLIDFSVKVINICKNMSEDYISRHLSVQLLRSATSVAANYGEARGAESRKDFVHKLRICLKELNETTIWLKIIKGSNFIEENDIRILLSEGKELQKIIGSSLSTLKQSK